MRRQDLLAEAVLLTKPLVARLLTGFDDSNATRQAANLPNHAAWCLGHMSFVMNRLAEKLDGRGFDDTQFNPGPKGDARRFGIESVAVRSEPVQDATIYPTLARCTEIFDAACDRVATGAANASDATLDQFVPWGTIEAPLWTLVMRMPFHNGLHAGQIADMRRGQGMKRLFS